MLSSDGNIQQEGRKLIAENIKFVADEVLASFSKPADPKKDAKSTRCY